MSHYQGGSLKNKRPLKIYLGDLTYTTVTIATEAFPLNVGYIAGYCKKLFGNDIEITLFKYIDEIDKAVNENPPDILANKTKYEFLKWDCELGDCVMFDIRTLHGTLSSSVPKKTLSRYTLRVAKEDTKIDYVGDWTSFNYRRAMQDAGYKNGDKLGGAMFPQLWPKNN